MNQALGDEIKKLQKQEQELQEKQNGYNRTIKDRKTFWVKM